jgi:osmoprotectant transport system ATP-binding protein
VIEFRNVSKRYDGSFAVDDLSFTVAEGAIGVLIGTSGSGKSTALRMVNRLIDPSSGTIHLSGTTVEQLPPVKLRRRIGYVIQSVGLFPHWTVERNIGTVPHLLGWPKAKIRDRVAQLLDLLRLDANAVRHKYPHQLSGGQQQRVGVARALAADPDVLLMDEPFGALDPITRTALQDEIAFIHQQTKKTILLVTHDIEEALKLGDTIALLDRGKLVQAGTPRDLLTAPANDFVRDFFGGANLGLRLLEIETAATVMRPEKRIDGERNEAEAIPASMSLHRALSLMVARGVDRLPVVDDKGAPQGTLHLADLAKR